MSYITLTRCLVLITSFILLSACSNSDDPQSSAAQEEKFEMFAVPTKGQDTIAQNLKLVSLTFSKAVEPDSVSTDKIIVTPAVNFELDTSLLVTRRVIFIIISEGLEANQQYTFDINGIKELGTTLERDFSWSYSTLNDVDLTAPTMLSTLPADNTGSVSDRTDKIQITFDEDINISSNSNFTVLPAIAGTIRINNDTIELTPSSSLNANQNYNVSVTGISDSFGNNADDVAFSFTTGADSTAPTSPSPLTSTLVTDDRVNLSWSASSDINGFNNYQIFRGTVSQNMVAISTTTSLTFSDTTVSPLTAYIYQIIARDDAGNASASNLLNVSTLQMPDNQAPTAVTLTTASAPVSSSPTNSSVALSWNSATDNVAVTGYRVERALSSGPFSTLAANITTTTFTDNSATPSTSYRYQVIAFDGAANESTSNILSLTTPAFIDGISPSAPSSLQATNITDALISLSWNASTDNIAVTGYRVMKAVGSGSLSLLTTSSSLTFTDNAINPSTNYKYQIIAVDGAGNTAASTIISVTSLAESDVSAPTNPAGLTTSASPTFSNVQLSWNASTDNVAVTGYKLNRRVSGGTWGTLVNSQLATTFNDASVSQSTAYQYQVFAFDMAGNQSASTILDVTTPAEPDSTAPVFSANLRTTATPTSTSIAVKWNAASDNVGVTGYRLMKSTNGATAVSIANATSLSFSDSSVNESSSYRYQVFAYDLAGNETASNFLNVTTPQLMSAANDTFSTPFETVLNGNLSINDSVSLNSPSTWLLVSQAASGTAAINSNGSFTYTPATGFSGSVSFTYQMRDSLNNFSNIATATVTVQAQQAATACGTLYANNGGFNPVTSRTVTSIPNIAKPAKGVHYLDPDYGACVVRVSDHINDSATIAGRIVPDYSRRQVFNADQSRMLLLAGDGFWHLYDASTYSHIRRVSLQGDSVEFQWHPTNPNLLYRMAYNGGRQIILHDLTDTSDNTSSVVADFTNVTSINGYPGITNINTIWPNATRFMTGEEGAPSRDGRYWALMAIDISPDGTVVTTFGMIVYDMVTDTIVGVYDYATDGGGIGGPNNLSMSPSGTHVVALWNPPACDGQNGRPQGRGTLNNPCGTMAFNKDFTQATGLAFNGEHGDTATDINGRDVYVGIEYQSLGAIEIIDLETGNLVGNIETNMWIGGAVHISGRALDKPGWAVISHYAGSTVNAWYNQEVFLAKLDTNPVIVRLAKHQSNPADYWAQPHATISRDATKVVWGSNWGGATLDLDTYMVTVPVEALDGL